MYACTNAQLAMRRMKNRARQARHCKWKNLTVLALFISNYIFVKNIRPYMHYVCIYALCPYVLCIMWVCMSLYNICVYVCMYVCMYVCVWSIYPERSILLCLIITKYLFLAIKYVHGYQVNYQYVAGTSGIIHPSNRRVLFTLPPRSPDKRCSSRSSFGNMQKESSSLILTTLYFPNYIIIFISKAPR